MWRMSARPARLDAHFSARIFLRRQSLFLDMERAAPLLPLRAGGANLSRTVATLNWGPTHVLRTSRWHGPCRGGPALRESIRWIYAGDAPLDRFRLVRGSGLVRGWPLSHLVGHSQQPDAALRRGIGPSVRFPAGLQQFERQHRRQPGPASHL